MGKSVNEYYSEKMKQLLEMQKNEQSPALPSASKASSARRPDEKPTGKGYYEQFRTRVENEKQRPLEGEARSAPRPRTQKARNPLERTPVDAIRNRKPKASPDSSGARRGERPIGEKQRVKISPEQTARDKYEENLRYMEAIRTAKKARVRRKVRDALISVGLIVAVLVVMLVVVYRLLFVISDINIEGNLRYTSEEILTASGVMEGDNLYSFSSKDVGEIISLRCPNISYVDVERTPPGTIEFIVEEETGVFYAGFYGEYRLMSKSLRVLDSVSLDNAKKKGCVKLILPDIYRATAGKCLEFSAVKDDGYIYETCETLLESDLMERAGSLDLSDRFNIVLTVDGKYKIRLGDSKSMEVKLRIASAVLADEMFQADIKATIDVTNLSQTSVVVDEGLIIE